MGNLHFRTAMIALLGLIGLLVTGMTTGTAQAANEVEVQDKSANRSRVYTAYTDDQGSIFEVQFTTTTTGEKRRIRARIEVIMASTATDDLLVARHGIRCSPVGDPNYEQLYGVRNVLRGQTMVQTPRYTFTAGAPGDYRCWLWIGSGRPRPSGTGTTSNTFRIGWGSYIHATVPVHPESGQDFTPKDPSHLLHKGQASDENVLTWTAPAGTTMFSANGDSYLTTCTSKSGSTDPVTGKRLCEGYTNTYGTKVITKLIVTQVSADGSSYCAIYRFPSATGRESYITRDIHHMVVFNSGSVTVNTSPQCSRTFRIKIYVKNKDGGALMVHRQGTITAAIPTG